MEAAVFHFMRCKLYTLPVILVRMIAIIITMTWTRKSNENLGTKVFDAFLRANGI